MASTDLDLLDPDEFFADYDRRARERRERRSRHRLPRSQGMSGPLTSAPAGRLLIAATVLLALATVIGLLVLWPSGPARRNVHGLPPSVSATAGKSFTAPCGPSQCRELKISVHSQRSRVTLGPPSTAPEIAPGTPIRVSPVPLPRGQAAPPGYQPWQFADIDRHGSLMWLGLALLILAVVVIRLRGLLADAADPRPARRTTVFPFALGERAWFLAHSLPYGADCAISCGASLEKPGLIHHREGTRLSPSLGVVSWPRLEFRTATPRPWS